MTIPKESARGTATFTLTPTQDTIAEGDETIDVTGTADGFTVTKAEVTLTDDETAPASITLTTSPTSVLESASGTTVTVTATLGGSATRPSATDVVVSVGGGTATSGTDYAAVSRLHGDDPEGVGARHGDVHADADPGHASPRATRRSTSRARPMASPSPRRR